MKKPILVEIIIWTIVLCAVFLIAIFSYSKMFIEPNIYNIEFKDIDGITKGSPVRFMGINIGYVRSLKSKDKHINVQILVTKKDMKIPNGTVAKVEFFGLGGSKSIELMPPDGTCDVGILTSDTIRLIDVVDEAKGMVEIVEIIEQYVKGLSKENMQKFLEAVIDARDDKIQSVGKEIDKIENEVHKKAQTVKQKQGEISQKINKLNKNVEKINEIIKK
ncbi:MAG: MCE family protein [Candidatus Gastranaerophilales bacterium]|nr:MCE family protein [Candidatus Gastranaerophilales bacterium]